MNGHLPIGLRWRAALGARAVAQRMMVQDPTTQERWTVTSVPVVYWRLKDGLGRSPPDARNKPTDGFLVCLDDEATQGAAVRVLREVYHEPHLSLMWHCGWCISRTATQFLQHDGEWGDMDYDTIRDISPEMTLLHAAEAWKRRQP